MATWTLAALLDAREAWDYIAADDEAAADRIADRVITAANRLDKFRSMGRPGPEGERVFHVPRTPYNIHYQATVEGVEILRILHGARKWPP